jgi:hypothetical protein
MSVSQRTRNRHELQPLLTTRADHLLNNEEHVRRKVGFAHERICGKRVHELLTKLQDAHKDEGEKLTQRCRRKRAASRKRGGTKDIRRRSKLCR